MALPLDTSWLGWPQGETAGSGSGVPSKGCQTSSQGTRTAGFCFVPVANNFFLHGRVTSFLEWIKSKLEEEEEDPPCNV